MIISCPNCNAGFFVAPAQISATGRRVKCSKCKNIWHATIPSDTILKEDVIAQRLAPQNVIMGANLPAIIPINIPKILYIAPPLFFVLILISLWLFYPSLTSQIGLCGPMCFEKGVRIEEIAYNFDKSSHDVVVEYSIANRSLSKAAIPAVQIKLLDNDHKVLRSVQAVKDTLTLEPNSMIKAKTEFNNVASNTKYVHLALGSNMKFWFR